MNIVKHLSIHVSIHLSISDKDALMSTKIKVRGVNSSSA